MSLSPTTSVPSTTSAAGAFVINRFTELSTPSLALRAQQIHAESYLHEGYVTPQACGPDGRLLDEIDTVRGPHVEYWLVDRPGAVVAEQASGRRVRAQDSLNDLPGYARARDHLEPWAVELLLARPPDRVAELGAFSRTPASPRLTIFLLMAAVFQDSLRQRTEDVWLVTTTPRLLRAMERTFGTDVVRSAGRPTRVTHPAAPGTALVPTVIEPHRVLPALTLACSTPGSASSRRLDALRLLTGGLAVELLPPRPGCCSRGSLSERSGRRPRGTPRRGALSAPHAVATTHRPGP